MGSRRSPREEVAADAGIGGFGKDFAPEDRNYQSIREKARSVMEGKQSFTYGELEAIVARLLIER